MFPEKLHHLLEETEKQGSTQEIISWSADGKSFKVHDRERFTKEVLSTFFGTPILYRSFQRNLNLWNFQAVPRGPNKGYLFHPLFVRGKIHLVHAMKRVRIKGKRSKKGGAQDTPDGASLENDASNEAYAPSAAFRMEEELRKFNPAFNRIKRARADGTEPGDPSDNIAASEFPGSYSSLVLDERMRKIDSALRNSSMAALEQQSHFVPSISPTLRSSGVAASAQELALEEAYLRRAYLNSTLPPVGAPSALDLLPGGRSPLLGYSTAASALTPVDAPRLGVDHTFLSRGLVPSSLGLLDAASGYPVSMNGRVLGSASGGREWPV